jgi:hypothetical protein
VRPHRTENLLHRFPVAFVGGAEGLAVSDELRDIEGDILLRSFGRLRELGALARKVRVAVQPARPTRPEQKVPTS